MSSSLVTTLAATGKLAGVNHWVVGAGVFVLFLVLMGALLMFGAGRDHS
jgi:hypothetical protein